MIIRSNPDITSDLMADLGKQPLDVGMTSSLLLTFLMLLFLLSLNGKVVEQR